MSDVKRGLISDPVVTRFRGINKLQNIAGVNPDYALDCLNAVCSLSGGLRKLRSPVDVFDGSFAGTNYGVFDFQQANGNRQIISIWDTSIYMVAAINGVWQTPTVIATDANYAHRWDAVSSNNILFMANGYFMLKWDGINLNFWGIKRLVDAPIVTLVDNGAGALNFLTGRQYRASLKNSVTNTVSSASDASLTSGPAIDAKIHVTVDAQAACAADAQIDTVVWYATLDGGVEYYWHSEMPVNKTGVTELIDDEPDPEDPTLKPTITDSGQQLADSNLQAPDAGGKWQFLVFNQPQWRTVGPNPAVGDLPIMIATKWGKNIPANAVITGIGVKVELANQNATTSYIHKTQLYYKGAPIGTANTPGTDPMTTTGVWYTYGSDSDMWGLDSNHLTPAVINDPTFGFGIQIDYAQNGGGQRVFLYAFSLIVYYQTQATPSPEAPLTLLRSAPLVNDPPPLGKYLAAWGGRIYIAGMMDAPQDVVYSGYEKILEGRPEETYPPGNRLRLAVGADWIRGFGVVQAGLVIGSRSNEMFMFRGSVEDVVTGTPLDFTEVLETLPFAAGFASHYSIKPTSDGMIFFSAQRSIDGYSGTGKPSTIANTIAPMLRDIPAGLEEQSQGVFYNYLDKDWYVFAAPVGIGATKPNKIFVVDLDSNDDNGGIYVFDIGAVDSLIVIEEPLTGRPMLCVAQGGKIKELNVILTGSNDMPTGGSTGATLTGYWQSGYFGQMPASYATTGKATPQLTKLFRHAYIISQQSGATAEIRLVEDRLHTFSSPLVISKTALQIDHGKITINKRSKRCSVKVIFPSADGEYGIQQMWVSYMPCAER